MNDNAFLNVDELIAGRMRPSVKLFVPIGTPAGVD